MNDGFVWCRQHSLFLCLVHLNLFGSMPVLYSTAAYVSVISNQTFCTTDLIWTQVMVCSRGLQPNEHMQFMPKEKRLQLLMFGEGLLTWEFWRVTAVEYVRSIIACTAQLPTIWETKGRFQKLRAPPIPLTVYRGFQLNGNYRWIILNSLGRLKALIVYFLPVMYSRPLRFALEII